MAFSLARWIINTMVSWRSIWCNSFCGVFVGIWWTLSLWSVIPFYIHESYLSFFDLLYAWSLIASYFFSDIWYFLANLIYLSCNGKRCFVMGLVMRCSFPATEGAARHVLIITIKDNKMGYIPTWIDLVYIMSCSYYITPFLHELNTLDACWIAVDVWSNSSRCRQESVY